MNLLLARLQAIAWLVKSASPCSGTRKTTQSGMPKLLWKSVHYASSVGFL